MGRPAMEGALTYTLHVANTWSMKIASDIAMATTAVPRIETPRSGPAKSQPMTKATTMARAKSPSIIAEFGTKK